jgi:hypothetical protein
MKDPAAGLQAPFTLRGIMDTDTVSPPITEAVLNLHSQMGVIYDDLGQPYTRQGVEVIFDKPFAADRQQWLGG